MNTTEHALSTLRRAAEHGYPWSIYPAEATALVTEVERLRAELKAERAAAVAWLRSEATRYTGEDLEPMQAMFSCGAGMTLVNAADSIERGEHRKETP